MRLFRGQHIIIIRSNIAITTIPNRSFLIYRTWCIPICTHHRISVNATTCVARKRIVGEPVQTSGDTFAFVTTIVVGLIHTSTALDYFLLAILRFYAIRGQQFQRREVLSVTVTVTVADVYAVVICMLLPMLIRLRRLRIVVFVFFLQLSIIRVGDICDMVYYCFFDDLDAIVITRYCTRK